MAPINKINYEISKLEKLKMDIIKERIKG